MNGTYLTLHSIDRLHQRYDIDRIEVCEAMASRAWRNGRTPDCFSGRMKKLLTDIQSREKDDIILMRRYILIYRSAGRTPQTLAVAPKRARS